jgi:predicted nucleotidyltransferase
MKTKAIPAELNQAIEIIKQNANPVRIILFGSRARGDNDPDSDYDILIVTKEAGNEREITRNIYKEMYQQNIMLDIELIAVNQDKWQSSKDQLGLIYKQVESEGVDLYRE